MEYSETSIKQMAIHRMGCLATGVPNQYSNCTFSMPQNDSPLQDLLKYYFLSSFKPDIQYHFEESSQIERENLVCSSVKQCFNNKELFFEESKKIAEWMLDSQPDKNLEGNDLYVVEFDFVVIQGIAVRCLGIFMSEHKDVFLQIQPFDNNFNIISNEGINIKKLDKGCLVFEMDVAEGYVVSIVNSDKKKGANVFWVEQFLRLTPRFDNFFFTQNYLSMCKSFVEKVYNEENEVSRTEQIDMLNRSFNFFQNNKNFSEANFEEQVMSTPEVKEAFHDFKSQFEEEKEVPPISNFIISNEAVKKQNSFFKSVIKLDKNFHVYVHGNRSFIEKGYDKSKGLSYYQLYFEEEN